MTGRDAVQAMVGRLGEVEEGVAELGLDEYAITTHEAAALLTAQQAEIDAKDAEIARLREALERIVEQSRVGKAGTTPLKSKWVHYPAILYHEARAALAGGTNDAEG